MQLVKIGDDYFNLNYLIKAQFQSPNSITLVFTDQRLVNTTLDEWERLLTGLNLDVPEIKKG